MEIDSDEKILEPSIIKTHDQVYHDAPQEVGKYPSFENLTPGQKYDFLTWLQDIEQRADIGYAYLLLYSLERHIYLGTMVEPAVHLISKLHLLIDDDDFVKHSSDSLVYAACKYKRVEFLNCLKTDLMPEETQVYVKLYTNGQLRAKDVMLVSEKLGMDNQRYILGKPKLYEKMLDDRLIDKYKRGNFGLHNIDHAGKSDISVSLSNFSIPKIHRSIMIPDLLHNKDLRKPLLSLLQDTNEDVKVELTGHYK